MSIKNKFLKDVVYSPIFLLKETFTFYTKPYNIVTALTSILLGLIVCFVIGHIIPNYMVGSSFLRVLIGATFGGLAMFFYSMKRIDIFLLSESKPNSNR